MFGSRKNRPPNPPLNASTASPSAATAALTAFRRESSASTSSLSAAAAAAALRARPATPTNVASVQTKRTVRRSASVSSSNFNTTTNPRRRNSVSPHHLRRHSSSGSMTERTFRSPSPGPQQRSHSTGSTPRTSYTMDDDPPPPMPAIPESVNMAAARARGARPKSLGIVTTPIKTASQRMAEKQNGGSWFGAAKVGDLGNVRTSDAVMRSPSVRTTAPAHAVSESPQHEDPGSGSRGSSQNFSYPARVRVASPGAEARQGDEGTRPQNQISPTTVPKPKNRSSTISPQRGVPTQSARPASIGSDQELVYDPNSRRMVPRAELQTFEQNEQTVPQKKPKKKKKAASERAGPHSARGMVGRAHGSAVDDNVPTAAQAAAAASLKSHRPETRQPVVFEQEEYYDEESESETGSKSQRDNFDKTRAPQPRTRHAEVSPSPAPHASKAFSPSTVDQREGGLERMPSVVMETSEDSASEAESRTSPSAAAALDAVPVRHSVYAHGVPSPPRSENTDDLASAELKARSTISPEPLQEKAERPEKLDVRRVSRDQSHSPGRSTRFGPVQETLAVKHEPPTRSLSPRKSALKRSPSPGASPIGYGSDVSGVDAPAQEPSVHRKKAFRVSFDDENTVVVGEAAPRVETDSPVPPSPQQGAVGGRKPWYSSLGIGRKKDVIPLEDDEVMKPRPALPTFGSVRSQKVSPKPDEERALVRPHDPLEGSSSPELERRTIASEDLGHSSDQTLGMIINDQASRTGANISKQREPLPPVVTSVEGGDYGSSDSASSDDEYTVLADKPKLPAEESVISEASTLVPPPSGSTAQQRAIEVRDFGVEDDAVPLISLTQPSPLPEELGEERKSYLHFPGGFPETETDSEGEGAASPPRQVTFEPTIQKEDGAATTHTPATVLATQPALLEPEHDSDGSSIYSDAYEDPLETEGDGFLSLDAVVDSPMITTPPRRVLEKAHAQRSGSTTPTAQSSQPGISFLSDPSDQWAAAKAYWRSLTAEKRAQLEKEAAEEAGAEADLEDVRQPETKKPRRKKSIEQRNAEKRTIELQRAVDPNRTYMINPGTKAGSIGSITNDSSPNAKAAAPQEDQTQPNGKGVENGTRLRKTMRASTAPQPVNGGPHFRRTMRAVAAPQSGDSGTHMRKSMRSSPLERPAPKQRPLSHQSVATTTAVLTNNVNTKHARSMSETPIPTGVYQTNLRRQGSDSSISSFQRARPATSAGGFAFRKTMRAQSGGGGGVVPFESQPRREQQRDPSSRFSLRMQSPPVSMRATLRGERRRSDDSGKGYLRFPGRSVKSETKGSRFGDDSSDDDEAVVTTSFKSRFDDSSDEDMTPAQPWSAVGAKTMRSGRGGPPSPPLPEEEEMSDPEGTVVSRASDEKAPGVTSAARSGRGMDGNTRRQRRTSFMNSVLRRNKKHDGGAKISRPELMESAARRDTTLERSTDELAALRGGSPKLQKRIVSMPTPTTTTNDSEQQQQQQQRDWPLTPTATEDDKDVFFDAADGLSPARRSPSVQGQDDNDTSQPSITGPVRPGFMMRRTTSATDGSGGGGGGGKGAKKKKFGALRRMLRLDE